MKCEISRNGNTIAGVMEFNATKVRDIVARQGGDARLVPNSLTGVLTIGSIVIKPATIVKPSLSRMESMTAAVRTETASQVTYTYGKKARGAELIREELVRSLASVHEAYDKSTTVHRGVTIKTDLEARINAQAVLDEFIAGNVTAAGWNGTDGQIPVASTEEMQAVKSAINAHLGLGFAAKDSVKTLIKAASESDLETLDVSAEFAAIISA
jgi:hypothetical protein